MAVNKTSIRPRGIDVIEIGTKIATTSLSFSANEHAGGLSLIVFNLGMHVVAEAALKGKTSYPPT